MYFIGMVMDIKSMYFIGMAITPSLTHKLLAFSSIYPLFVERFGRSLRFCHHEFYNEAISDAFIHVFLVFFYKFN